MNAHRAFADCREDEQLKIERKKELTKIVLARGENEAYAFTNVLLARGKNEAYAFANVLGKYREISHECQGIE